MKEIGSEFWLTKKSKEPYDNRLPQWLKLGIDNKLLLSGRTAIDFILRDILENKKIKSVYFPSYCCQSMLQPFMDHGVNIIFYEIDFDDKLILNINRMEECDIFFAVNYFGFTKGRMDSYIESFKKRNIIVIEDATHSLLSDASYNVQSDYIVASLRKWFPIVSGGLAVKATSMFSIKQKNGTLSEMTRIREKAMLQKGKYVNGDKYIEKKSFLKNYNDASEMLNKDYSLYSIDKASYKILQNLNVKSVVKKRENNLKFLYEKLITNKNFELLFPELESGDCPLYVPIIFNNNLERDSLRNHLIKRKVYCPIHWSKPSILSERNIDSIYDRELSLIVDQRYDVTDMQDLIRRLDELYE